MNELPNIGRVLEHYGAHLTRSSGRGSLKCPFHDDSHASAGVDFNANIFNCFTCGVSGNSIQIIARQEGISVNEAREFAKRIAGASDGKLSGEHRYGGGLPQRKGHHQRSGLVGSIRRSQSA